MARTEILETDLLGIANYRQRLNTALDNVDWSAVEELAAAVRTCWRNGHRLFLCGNGGSAANAVHIANDLAFGIGRGLRPAMRVHALPANVAIVTCLANDLGYEHIFAHQLAIEAQEGDILVVLSGSGNSPNIIEALKKARSIGVRSFGILGYSGGKAKALVDVPIHFVIDDMQVSEDLQTMVFHMIMQWLYKVGPTDESL
jgi:D-sedoheptulose 7-phosphate isomerase